MYNKENYPDAVKVLIAKILEQKEAWIDYRSKTKITVKATDFGRILGEIILEQYDCLYSKETKQLFYLDTEECIWYQVKEEAIDGIVSKVIKYLLDNKVINTEPPETGNTGYKEIITKILKVLKDVPNVKSFNKILRGKYKLFNNGVFNFSSGELETFDKEKHFFVNKINVDYSPVNYEELMETPIGEIVSDYLIPTTLNEEEKEELLEFESYFIGVAFFSNIFFKQILQLVSPERSTGKTTFINLLSEVMSEGSFLPTDMSSFATQFGREVLATQQRILFIDEPEIASNWKGQGTNIRRNLKKVQSGSITTEQKFKSSINIVFNLVIVIASNFLSLVGESSDTDAPMLIPFCKTWSKAEGNYFEEIQLQELDVAPYVNYCVGIVHKYYKNLAKRDIKRFPYEPIVPQSYWNLIAQVEGKANYIEQLAGMITAKSREEIKTFYDNRKVKGTSIRDTLTAKCEEIHPPVSFKSNRDFSALLDRVASYRGWKYIYKKSEFDGEEIKSYKIVKANIPSEIDKFIVLDDGEVPVIDF